jgi:U3 small nucleolar RNA-associated protein 7
MLQLSATFTQDTPYHQIYTAPTVHQAFTPKMPPPLYITHPIPHRPLTSLRFCPFQDILTIGHSAGLSSVLVPGSGEPNFDSAEADPFETKKARREREVKGLLEKVRAFLNSQCNFYLPFVIQIQPDMISLDPEFVGSLAPPSKLTSGSTDTPFARLPRLERLRTQGKADETEIANDSPEEDHSGKKQDREAREKRKMRGKGKSMKRFGPIIW